MTPALEKYITDKEKLLVDEFRLKLDSRDLAELTRCTTESSVDVAARKIIKQKWEANEYVA